MYYVGGSCNDFGGQRRFSRWLKRYFTHYIFACEGCKSRMQNAVGFVDAKKNIVNNTMHFTIFFLLLTFKVFFIIFEVKWKAPLIKCLFARSKNAAKGTVYL